MRSHLARRLAQRIAAAATLGRLEAARCTVERHYIECRLSRGDHEALSRLHRRTHERLLQRAIQHSLGLVKREDPRVAGLGPRVPRPAVRGSDWTNNPLAPATPS